MIMKQMGRLYSLLFALALTGFSVWALLDTFVIERVYATVEPSSAAQQTSTAVTVASLHSEDTQPEITSHSYADENVAVTLETYRENDTTIYVADILLSDLAALQTAFSRGSYGRNVTADTSVTAEAAGAILAVNGDNYGAREKGYVIRGGVLYRDSSAGDQEDLVIWEDGSFSIINESEVTARELLAAGAREVFSFGPGLLSQGEITVGVKDEVDRAKASNPRTAIGIIGPGHYVLVVSDGRTEESEGLTLYQLAEFLQSLGVQTAYNLDGGGSSTMVFLGQVVNRPVGGRGRGERAVTDIVYVC